MTPPFPLPSVPWQVTGNHWIALPCIHPADGAVHALSFVHRASRGAMEFSGAADYWKNAGRPLLRPLIVVDGTRMDLAASPMAWQRRHEWIPAFGSTSGGIAVSGRIAAPAGRDVDLPGVVYSLALENRTARSLTVAVGAEGTLGHRQLRVRTARAFLDPHAVSVHDARSIVLAGSSPASAGAVAISLGDDADAAATAGAAGADWSLSREVQLAPGARVETAIHIALALEPDGSLAVLAAMRRIGHAELMRATDSALATLAQSTGSAAVDRLVNRHLMLAYFFAVARALDDAQLYPVRSRAPWNAHGLTVRDWDSLMWTIPAVQLADAELARDLLLRMCEVHGYAPGRGVNYLDGAPFSVEFSLDAVAAYPIAVDRYLVQTDDATIVEEPALADTLYTAHAEIRGRRHPAIPLYATTVAPSGARPEFAYTLHGNAAVANALDVLRETLDENTAEGVELGDVVRAALTRHLTAEREGSRAFLATAADLNGGLSTRDDPVGSAAWIPMYEAVSAADSTYRRTLRRVAPAPGALELAHQVARLIGPDGAELLAWLRRAPLDNGAAAELVDEAGNAIASGGDAALSGLVAFTVWYAVHALGVRL